MKKFPADTTRIYTKYFQLVPTKVFFTNGASRRDYIIQVDFILLLTIVNLYDCIKAE